MATLTEVMARRERERERDREIRSPPAAGLWPRAHFPVAKMAMPAGKTFFSRSAVSRDRVHREPDSGQGLRRDRIYKLALLIRRKRQR